MTEKPKNLYPNPNLFYLKEPNRHKRINLNDVLCQNKPVNVEICNITREKIQRKARDRNKIRGKSEVVFTKILNLDNSKDKFINRPKLTNKKTTNLVEHIVPPTTSVVETKPEEWSF